MERGFLCWTDNTCNTPNVTVLTCEKHLVTMNGEGCLNWSQWDSSRPEAYSTPAIVLLSLKARSSSYQMSFCLAASTAKQAHKKKKHVGNDKKAHEETMMKIKDVGND